jgi:ceramide glucosyltransferase
VRDPRLHGPNRKVSQLMNLEALARHPVLVVADADMAVPPHWLTAVTAPLADPAIGLVTCLYRGEAGDAGRWSRLAALWIDWQFLPNAALGEAMGRAHGCYGATMALRAETLARLGGFAALSGLLADDHALGVAVRRLGLRVVVAPVLPAHVMAEPGLLALVRHELRWARTLRLLDLPGYAGMGVTFPLAWGALAAALVPAGFPWGWLALAVALAARVVLAVRVDRALRRGRSLRRLALLPLRDALSFAIWGLGLARGTVTWQGRRFRMRRDGSMVDAES